MESVSRYVLKKKRKKTKKRKLRLRYFVSSLIEGERENKNKRKAGRLTRAEPGRLPCTGEGGGGRKVREEKRKSNCFSRRNSSAFDITNGESVRCP